MKGNVGVPSSKEVVSMSDNNSLMKDLSASIYMYQIKDLKQWKEDISWVNLKIVGERIMDINED